MKKKCYSCNKKLDIVECLTNKCKCDNYFCSKHLFYVDHECTFNYVIDYKEKATSNIIDLTCKVIKI
jgi:predicted nucleic acid binding AN1-type Zn finger protein